MKKWNDSGYICRLTLSWKAPSTQIRIFLKAYLYIYFSHVSAFRLVFRSHTKPVNPLTETLGWFNNRTGTSVEDGKARGKDWTRLPVLNLLLCHWSSQLFDLRAPSSTDDPILLLNQPIKHVTQCLITRWNTSKFVKIVCCATYFQLSSQSSIWWWNTTSHSRYITSTTHNVGPPCAV